MADTADQTIDTNDAPFFGVSVVGGIPADDELTPLLAKVMELETAHTALLSADARELDTKRQEYDAESQRLVGKLGGFADITGAAQKLTNEKHEEHRKTVLAASERYRSDQLKQLAAANAKAETLLKVFPGPVQMLGTFGLGDEKRTHYSAQLANAGHSQLQSLARYALAKGDFVLGAAVADRVAQLPKESRPFSANQLADAFVGRRHAEMTRAAKTIANAFQRVVNADRDHVRGRRNTVARMSNAIRESQIRKGK